MSDYKLFIAFRDGVNFLLTFSEGQWGQLLEEADFMAVKPGTPEFGKLAIESAKDGYCKTLRVTRDSKEKVFEEIKRNYPGTVSYEDYHGQEKEFE